MADHRPRTPRPSRAARPDDTGAPVAATPGTTIADPDVATTFAALGVPPELCEVMARDGITAPFPIQTATLPDSLEGRDVLGRGRTGSGKTLAFALPVLTRLAANRRDRKPGRPRALILAPTRELAIQIDAAIAPLAKPLGLRTTTIFGGVGQNPQVERPAQRRRHRRRLPRPPRGPHPAAPLRPRHGRDHRARRGRPHGRPRVPARRSSASWTARPTRASACSSRPRSTRASTPS